MGANPSPTSQFRESPLMIGKTVSHYRIIKQLGEGGMGVVYQAEDTKLKRTVALKFLALELSRDPEAMDRLLKEARAASRLDHPNICTVHEINETQGHPFIAMAFVEGKTLKDMLAEGPVGIGDSVDIAIQAADGLREAHEKGIIHRDIKNTNIMVTPRGQAKIMDFGIAKLAEAQESAEAQTTTGGTAAYMSPEQIRGEGTDERTDVWSLGVVLYELLAGRRPFAGDYEHAIFYSILNEAPESLTFVRSEVPGDLVAVVKKALEKDLAKRYQKMEEMLHDLKSVSQRLSGKTSPRFAAAPSGQESTLGADAGPAAGQKPAPSEKTTPAAPVGATTSRALVRRLRVPVVASLVVIIAVAVGIRVQWGKQAPAVAEERTLAVMYFDNLTDPEDKDRLGEIAANLIITDLSESQYVRVISSQHLYDILKRLGREGERSLGPDVASRVAREAGAKWMLTGSILRVSPRIELTAQLVDVATGQVQASQHIAGAPGEEIFPLIDRLTAELKTDLALPSAARSELSPVIADVTTHSQEAYRFYLEGVDYYQKFDWTSAERSLIRAVQYDSTFAMGYYWLALASWATGSGKQREHIGKAVEQAARATPKERLYITSLNAYIGQDCKQAAALLKTLVKRYPDEKQAYFMLGQAYFDGIGDLVQAVGYFNKTIEIDPLFKGPYNSLAYSYSRLGDLDRAMWALDKYAALAPDEPNPHDSKGDVLAENGDIEGAILSYRRALDVRPDFSPSLFKLAAACAMTDQFARADSCYRVLASFPERPTRSDARASFAQIAIRQGKFTEALCILDEAAASDRMEGYERGLVSGQTRKALVLLDRGEARAALSEFEKGAALAVKVRPDERLFESVSYVYFLSRAGDFKKASEVAQKLKRTAREKDEVIR